MKKRTAIIAGATGLVGSHLVTQLIKDDCYDNIYIVGRRGAKRESSKVTFYKSDFVSFPTITAKNQIDFFCALGTTIKKAKTQENFRQIDYQAVVNLAKWASELNAKNFIVISSVGANQKSKNFYLRTKGEMENAINRCAIDNITIIRPSLIVGKRDEFRLAEKLGEYFLMLFNFFLVGSLMKYKSIKAEKIASKMIYATKSNDKNSITIVEGKSLHSS